MKKTVRIILLFRKAMGEIMFLLNCNEVVIYCIGTEISAHRISLCYVTNYFMDYMKSSF
jgi:hypothetical protein